MGPQDEQSFAEIGASLLIVHLGPEQRGELVPWLRLAGVTCEVSQERLGLLARDRHRRARTRLELDAAEEAQPSKSHRRQTVHGLTRTRNRRPTLGTGRGTLSATFRERTLRRPVAMDRLLARATLFAGLDERAL